MRTLRLFGSVLRVELLSAVWFGGALTAWNAWQDGGTFSIVRALTLGAFYLVVMGLFVTAGQLWAMRGTPRGQSITAWQESTVAVPPARDLAGQIVRALQSLPAQVIEIDVATGRYVARTSRPRHAAAEVVVQLDGDPAAPVAHVTSAPARRRSLADHGAGRRNVQAVTRQLIGRPGA